MQRLSLDSFQCTYQGAFQIIQMLDFQSLNPVLTLQIFKYFKRLLMHFLTLHENHTYSMESYQTFGFFTKEFGATQTSSINS